MQLLSYLALLLSVCATITSASSRWGYGSTNKTPETQVADLLRNLDQAAKEKSLPAFERDFVKHYPVTSFPVLHQERFASLLAYKLLRHHETISDLSKEAQATLTRVLSIFTPNSSANKKARTTYPRGNCERARYVHWVTANLGAWEGGKSPASQQEPSKDSKYKIYREDQEARGRKEDSQEDGTKSRESRSDSDGCEKSDSEESSVSSSEDGVNQSGLIKVPTVLAEDGDSVEEHHDLDQEKESEKIASTSGASVVSSNQQSVSEEHSEEPSLIETAPKDTSIEVLHQPANPMFGGGDADITSTQSNKEGVSFSEEEASSSVPSLEGEVKPNGHDSESTEVMSDDGVPVSEIVDEMSFEDNKAEQPQVSNAVPSYSSSSSFSSSSSSDSSSSDSQKRAEASDYNGQGELSPPQEQGDSQGLSHSDESLSSASSNQPDTDVPSTSSAIEPTSILREPHSFDGTKKVTFVGLSDDSSLEGSEGSSSPLLDVAMQQQDSKSPERPRPKLTRTDSGFSWLGDVLESSSHKIPAPTSPSEGSPTSNEGLYEIIDENTEQDFFHSEEENEDSSQDDDENWPNEYPDEEDEESQEEDERDPTDEAHEELESGLEEADLFTLGSPELSSSGRQDSDGSDNKVDETAAIDEDGEASAVIVVSEEESSQVEEGSSEVIVQDSEHGSSGESESDGSEPQPASVSSAPGSEEVSQSEDSEDVATTSTDTVPLMYPNPRRPGRKYIKYERRPLGKKRRRLWRLIFGRSKRPLTLKRLQQSPRHRDQADRMQEIRRRARERQELERQERERQELERQELERERQERRRQKRAEKRRRYRWRRRQRKLEKQLRDAAQETQRAKRKHEPVERQAHERDDRVRPPLKFSKLRSFSRHQKRSRRSPSFLEEQKKRVKSWISTV